MRAVASFEAVLIYLFIYAAMNLGAFAVVIAVARRTGSAEIDTYAGLGQTSPGLAVTLTIFLFSLAGIPPFAGWFAKFVMFRAVLDANSPSAIVLGVIAAVGSVVAFFYYAGVARKMWFHDPAPEAATTPRPIPAALTVAIGLCAAVTVVVGIYPQIFAQSASSRSDSFARSLRGGIPASRAFARWRAACARCARLRPPRSCAVSGSFARSARSTGSPDGR